MRRKNKRYINKKGHEVEIKYVDKNEEEEKEEKEEEEQKD